MEADCARGDRSRQCGSRRNGSAVSRFAVPLSRLVLVPSGRIAFHQVTLPHRTWRQRLQVLPFLLEEQLATDIEQLHFAILHQSGDRCDVAVVEKRLCIAG